ncbi:MAG: TetR/AcrR family transcriptional regulator [Synechococcaceae cyanobacterium SM2_3_2]|nr:TetR/AcrR family transcriptional regulator [Synechococcaceae cyanobacterium SM2_3_2]
MPKIVDHDHYRKELLLRSFDLFAERGYGSLTMRQLAQGLGVSTGTLYHYFESKEVLFVKLMEELAQQSFLQVEAILNLAGGLEERIEAIFRWLQEKEDFYSKELLLCLSFYQEQHNSKELLESSGLLATVNQRYQQISEQYLGIKDPEIAILIDNLIGGLILNRLSGMTTISYEQQGRLLARMLRTYLDVYGAVDE